jgi:hypothetical protein
VAQPSSGYKAEQRHGLAPGLRVRLGRQHVRNGIATIKTEKSGYRVEVSLPMEVDDPRTPARGRMGTLSSPSLLFLYKIFKKMIFENQAIYPANHSCY